MNETIASFLENVNAKICSSKIIVLIFKMVDKKNKTNVKKKVQEIIREIKRVKLGKTKREKIKVRK